MNKKIIFFDGDGILWYPKSSKWSKPPHWIYAVHPEVPDYIKHLTTTPSLKTVLQDLKAKGCLLIALSNIAHTKSVADMHMKSKVTYFGLDDLLDGVYTARPTLSGKGAKMVEILKRKHIPKSQALLIGDSYLYDYRSAKEAGIDCLLLKTPYTKRPPRGPAVQKTIDSLTELVGLIG